MAFVTFEQLEEFVEGLSARGGEGLGGRGEGFEVQNDGEVRRWPGEGPGVNGGRSQSQEMDSFDQPQYLEAAGDEYDFTRDNPFIDTAMGMDQARHSGKPFRSATRISTQPTGGYDFTRDNDAIARAVAQSNLKMGIKEFMGVRDADTIEKQDTHVGSQESGGPIAKMSEVFAGELELYTLKPEANGVGRLEAGGEPDPLAVGPIGDLMSALFDKHPELVDLADEIQRAFERAVSDGAEVAVDPSGPSVQVVGGGEEE